MAAILPENVQVYKAQDMTDSDMGGGRMSPDTVPDGQINNLFSNISRKDRVAGSIELRKIFAKINTPGVPAYGGSHVIVKKPPTDRNVSVLLIDTHDFDDKRPDIINYLESYHVLEGSAGNAVTKYEVNAGSSKLVFETLRYEYEPVYRDYGDRTVMYERKIDSRSFLDAKVGDLIYIGKYPDGEYHHVQMIEKKRQQLDKPSWLHYYMVEILVVTLSKPTKKAFPAGTGARKTGLNPSWKVYGAMRLKNEAGPDTLAIEVESVEARISPVICRRIDSAFSHLFLPPLIVSDYACGPGGVVVIPSAKQTGVSEWVDVIAGQYAYAFSLKNGPAVPGTMSLWYRAGGRWRGLSDAVTSGSLSGNGEGSVDYTGGICSFTADAQPEEGTHILVFYTRKHNFEEHLDTPLILTGTVKGTFSGSVVKTSGKPVSGIYSHWLPDNFLSGSTGRLTINGCKRDIFFLNGKYVVGDASSGVEVPFDLGDDLEARIYSSGERWREIYITLKNITVESAGRADYSGSYEYLVKGSGQMPFSFNLPEPCLPNSLVMDYKISGGRTVSVTDKGGELVIADAPSPLPAPVFPIKGPVYAAGQPILSMIGGYAGLVILWGGDMGGYVYNDYGYENGQISLSSLGMTDARCICPSESSFLMVAAASDRVCYSPDKDAPWQAVNGIQGGANWVAVSGGVWIIAADSGLYRSGDGMEYQKLETGTQVAWLKVYKWGRRILACAAGCLALSTDNGNNWETFSSPGDIFSAVYSIKENAFYLAADTGFYKTTDFNDYNKIAISNDYVKYLAIDAAGAVLAVCQRTPPYAAGLTSPYAYYATDGSTWAYVTVTTGLSGSYIGVMGACVWKNKWITVGYATNTTTGNIARLSLAQAADGILDTAGNLLSVVGGFDCLTGKGTIDKGMIPSNALAKYYLTPKEIKNAAIFCEGTEDLIAGSLKIRAASDSDPSGTVYLSDSGGALAGDGTGFVSMSKGYALATFSQPVVPHTIEIAYSAELVYQPEFEGVNTEALPLKGCVPVVTEGDMIVVSDSQHKEEVSVIGISGNRLTLSANLVNTYAPGSIVSTALQKGNLQARVNARFTTSTVPQRPWPDESSASANDSYNFASWPVVVSNIGAETEKWLVRVSSSSHFRVTVTGESIGTLLEDYDCLANDIAPMNPNTNQPYFILKKEGWPPDGGTFQPGNCIRLNIIGADAPFWILRAVDARPSNSTNDGAVIEICGDSPD